MRLTIAALVVSLTVGCGGAPDQVANDAGPEAVGGDVSPPDATDEGAEDGDAHRAPEPGSITLVVSEVGLTAERECDFDGDGVGDNAIADLGEPSASLMVAALSTGMQGMLETGWIWLLLLHNLEDVRGPDDPEARLVIGLGQDLDVPPDPSDDFSGEEPFFLDSRLLDGCGEPVYSMPTSIRGGVAEASAETFPFIFFDANIQDARLGGAIEPGGGGAEATICGTLLIGEAGASSGYVPGFTLLEYAAAGGAILGIPTLPGLTPNVDVDGDGLERLVIDESGHLAGCVDGDMTEIGGADCWADERMADGFALFSRLVAVPARFAGRAPGWEYEVASTCDEPPAESLIHRETEGETRCAPLDEPCEPLAAEPCCDPAHTCSGADRIGYRCLEPCSPTSCVYLGRSFGYCAAAPEGSGSCWPLRSLPALSGCAPGEEGCLPEWPTGEATTCVSAATGVHCLASCSPAESGCDDPGDACKPLPSGEGGLCLAPASAY